MIPTITCRDQAFRCRIAILSVIYTLTYSVPLHSAVSTGYASGFFAQVADGGGWQSRIALTNLSVDSRRFRVEFRDSSGSQLDVTLTDGRRGWFFEGTIYGRGTTFLYTAGSSANLREGFVRVSAPECASYDAGVYCGAGINNVIGTLIFRYSSSGRPPIDAAVALDSPDYGVVFPFDATNGSGTALAVLNPFVGFGQRVVVTFRDENGGVLNQKALDLAPRSRRTLLAFQFAPEVVGRRGTISIAGDNQFVAFGLSTNEAGGFSTVLPTQIP